MKNKIIKENFYFYKNKRNLKVLIGLIALLILISIIGISMGASKVGLGVIKDFFIEFINPGSTNLSEVDKIVLINIRLPRVMVAILVGMGLSSAGLLMQGVFQNPLVSPYTLGISNGAAFGAAVSILLGLNLTWLGSYSIPLFAFIFSIITMLMVYGIAVVSNNSTKTLVLSGVAIGYLFSALVSFLKYISSENDLPEIVFWMMGGMSGISWEKILIIFIIVTIGILIMVRYAWDLNVMTLGEEISKSMGVEYKAKRNLFLIVATMMTAVSVAFTGIIGFVGIIAPHISRIFFGSDYRYLIPGTALVGGILLLLSDTVGRNILAPTEIPVGIITSFIGVPFFLYLIIRQRRM